MASKRKSTETFKKGEQVHARWAGSKKFYDGKIVDILKTVCKVQFDNDGSISSVKIADIKKFDKSSAEAGSKTERSKSRSRSRSVGRPGRSKSRSPGRPKAPGRPKGSTREKTKSETRMEQSPGTSEKTTKTNSLGKDVVDTNLRVHLTREKIVSSNIIPSEKINSFIKEQTTVQSSEETSSERLRTSRRLTALRSMETSQRESNTKSSGKSNYSDDDDEEEEEKEKVASPKSSYAMFIQVWNFLATFLKIFLIPGCLLFLVFACTPKQCTVLEMPHFFSRWSVLFNSVKLPVLAISAFHILLCFLPLIPLGKKVVGFSTADSQTPLEYRLHGIIYLICSAVIFGGCSYFGVNMNWGYDKFKPIVLSAFVYCFMCALLMYAVHAIRGFGSVESKVPFIGKFYYGSFVNPLFDKINIKTSFIQTGIIGSVILNMSILTKYLLVKGYRTALPLGLTCGMELLFALDLLFREESLLSTATYTTDSVGYAFIMTMGFLVPVGLSALNVYHYFHEVKITLSSYCYYSIIAAIVILFLVGYYLYFTSSNLKHKFRRDPYGKSMLKYDSIATHMKSKRLLVSGGWGLVRHPNYLGLLMMATAWTLPCGFTHFPPYGPLIMLAIALVFRIFSVEKDCEEKYGPGWKTYTEKVRSRLIPYIF